MLRNAFKSFSTFCLYSRSLLSSVSKASSLALRTVVSVLLEVALVLTLTSDIKSSGFLVAQNLSAIAFSFLTLYDRREQTKQKEKEVLELEKYWLANKVRDESFAFPFHPNQTLCFGGEEIRRKRTYLSPRLGHLHLVQIVSHLELFFFIFRKKQEVLLATDTSKEKHIP